jgi:hypothetical protein
MSLLGGTQAGQSRALTPNQIFTPGGQKNVRAAAAGPSWTFDPNALAGLPQRLGLTSPLQQQTTDAFSNFLAQPSAQERTLAQFQGPLGELLAGRGIADPASVLNAAQPVFDRNLAEALATQREAGPRFASTAMRETGRLQQGALQDFNLFAQQTLESGRQRQLQAQLGAASALGGLAGGVDQTRLGGMQAAGQFGLGISQQQLAALMPLLQQLFSAGGLNSAPGFVQRPSFLGQVAGLAGAAGGLATGLGGAGNALFGMTGMGGNL